MQRNPSRWLANFVESVVMPPREQRELFNFSVTSLALLCRRLAR